MPEVVQVVHRRYQVVLDVTVTLTPIDASLLPTIVERYNNSELLHDPEIIAQIGRNARVRDAVCADPQLMDAEMRRRIAWRLEPLHPIDAIARDLALPPHDQADAALVAGVAPRLPADDAATLREAHEAGLLSDHTDIYDEAFRVDIERISLMPGVPDVVAAHDASSTPSPDHHHNDHTL